MPLAPALCVIVGAAQVDIAGAASLVRIAAGSSKTVDKSVDAALGGPIAPNLAELARALEGR
jgi:hypothetical protein